MDAGTVEEFIQKGYCKIEGAFPKAIATAAREILWKDTGCDPDDPTTWTKPVIRLGDYSGGPFQQAANTPVLHNAFDALVGKHRWFPRGSLGSFPIRFPGLANPGDDGWHVDASFPGETPNDYFTWRINIKSRGRALLMLFLFSDVSHKDAPTRIRAGSHFDVARILDPAGDTGLSFMEVAQKLVISDERHEVFATGEAGTVYLCHPFIAHAAQPHHGSTPRFLAQPPLQLKEDCQLHRPDGNYSPVEMAIRISLDY
jgi:hypothetical protein